MLPMAKGRVIEDKPRKRRTSSRTDDVTASENSSNAFGPKNATSNIKTSTIDKSRMRKPIRRQPSKRFVDFGRDFPRRAITVVFAVVFLAILLYFGIQRYDALRKKRLVYSPIQLTKLILTNETGPESSPDLFWGTYRPGIYFGFSHRSPHSILFGLVWTTQGTLNPKFRHDCSQSDNLKRYSWLEHDGRNFGIQSIIDGNHNITLSFVKRPAISFGGDWTARISVAAVNKSISVKPISFMFYAYLPDSSRGMLQAFARGSELLRLRGFTHELGAFQVNFHVESGNAHGKAPIQQSHLSGYCPREDQILTSILSSLAFRDEQSKLLFLTGRQHFDPSFTPPRQSNLWVTEVTVLPSDVPGHVLEVEFVSLASTSSDTLPIVRDYFDAKLINYSTEFHRKFHERFPSTSLNYTKDQLTLSKSALSNLLGGIGYFYGTSSIRSSLLGPDPIDYWPTSLFTATPSRQQFPRGFLWDEGFHGLLLARWDVELALQSLSHWLDLMNAEGWIPREQILGWEARSRVPSEFFVQSTSVANPPTLILVVEALMKSFPKMHQKDAELFSTWAVTAFPRLHSWFRWFNTTQLGPLPTSYRWRGRPVENPFQLNPLTLSSGLDDYPRASHPSPDERHLDLRCWMTLFARVLSNLSEFIAQVTKSQSQGAVDVGHLHRVYSEWAAVLTDPVKLDALHWSNEHSMYADFGLHTDSISLVRPNTVPPSEPPPQKQRHVTNTPKYQHITSAYGYISLFPLLLRLLPPDSPRLPVVLEKMSRPDLLFSPFGLRSLSLTSPYYNRANTEHDPPYWRGSLWINMNFLAHQSLRYYATNTEVAADVAKMAQALATSLGRSLVSTVIGEFNRTGFLWEQYDDQTGVGKRAHPFSGWTTLITMIMADEEN